jgi:hypothetical protein
VNQFPGMTCMYFELRKFLVIFLALLQLVAPLVHAHAGEESPALPNTSLGKLHIPGLEAYGVAHESSMIEATGHHYNAEGFIIAVDAGINQNQSKLINDAGNNYFLPSQSIAIKPSISLFDCNFSSSVPIYACRLLVASHTPRAPPFTAQ